MHYREIYKAPTVAKYIAVFIFRYCLPRVWWDEAAAWWLLSVPVTTENSAEHWSNCGLLRARVTVRKSESRASVDCGSGQLYGVTTWTDSDSKTPRLSTQFFALGTVLQSQIWSDSSLQSPDRGTSLEPESSLNGAMPTLATQNFTPTFARSAMSQRNWRKEKLHI